MLEFIRGLVRPLVTFAVTGAAIYGFVVKLIAPEVFIPMVTLILVFWFEERSIEKAKE